MKIILAMIGLYGSLFLVVTAEAEATILYGLYVALVVMIPLVFALMYVWQKILPLSQYE